MKRMSFPRKRAVASLWLPVALVLLAPAFANAPWASVAQSEKARLLERIRAADMRLARIGYRLAVSNAALCDRLEPGTGMLLHTIDQYAPDFREDAKRVFGLQTGVAVEGVVADGPAARAGVVANDALTQIGSVPVAGPGDTPAATASTGRLISLHTAIAGLPPSAPIALGLVRGEEAPRRLTIEPVPACRSRFELAIGPGFDAQADGAMVQIGVRFLEEYPDEQAAVIVAHELAHNILRHRERLEARGVDWGMLAGFGGNVKYFRQTEIEADLLGIHLLANAGYDPALALAFWRKFGPSHAGSFLRARTHPHWRDRVATLEAEAARIAASPERPSRPAVLGSRDRPLDGNWQPLLVKAR